jgi:PHP family Zn ribbon phosphoesterase
MSADPGMLWRFKEQFNVVSFSDAHSMWPWRIGREATIFDVPKLTYSNVMRAIRTGEGLAGTIETPPAYGRYHWDGHRDCGFSSSPQETKRLNGICPKCGKKLIIGVDYRVEELAKEPEGYRPKDAKPYYLLVPLNELIAFHLGTTLLSSKKVWEVYNGLIDRFKTEFNIMIDVEEKDLTAALPEDKDLVKLILLNREGKLPIQPGYDGVYGKINLPGGKAGSGKPEQPTKVQKPNQSGLSKFLDK